MRTPEELAPHLYVNAVTMELHPDGELELSVTLASYEYVYGDHCIEVAIEDGKAVAVEM